jgi:diguanylate cyclase (GGDEF)-like protein
MPREISFDGHVILQERILIVQDALNDIRFMDNPLVLGKPNIRFYLGCPLKSKEQFNIGTLCLIDDKLQQFNEIDLNAIHELAAKIEAEFDIMHLITTDELTQLSNRKGFITHGKQLIKLCKQYDKNLLLLYFDLNQFKFINNNYGRNEAEKVLKIFSQQLLKNFRHSDAVARIGEDTFYVLCPDLSKEQLPDVIKRFRHKLSAAQNNYTIEFNAGSIQYDGMKHHSINALIEDADEKIYEHKNFK